MCVCWIVASKLFCFQVLLLPHGPRLTRVVRQRGGRAAFELERDGAASAAPGGCAGLSADGASAHHGAARPGEHPGIPWEHR